MPVLSWEGNGSGHSLCLSLACQILSFGGELSNALEEVLVPSYVSADFAAHRDNVAGGSLGTLVLV